MSWARGWLRGPAMAGADESSGAGASLAAAGGPQFHHIGAEQVLLPAAPSSPASPSPELTWENLPPNAVVRVIMSFCRRAELLQAVQVCRSWASVLLLDEVCEDLATSMIYQELAAHVKNVKWPDPRRSYRSFLSGYLRALRHSDEQERWWGRYKVTFCLAIPSVLQRGGPATCWGCEECSWRWEAGLLQGGFAFNVSRFSVCNWLSIPLQPAMERLLVNPDSSFFTEAALLDRETGRFAKLFACADRDVALHRQVEVENLAANGAVSSVQVTEGFKPVPSRARGSSSRPAQLRLRYTFTAYDWSEEQVRFKLTACHLDMRQPASKAASPTADGNAAAAPDQQQQAGAAPLAAAAGGGGGGEVGGAGEEEEEAVPAWRVLKEWVEGLTWV